MDRSTLVGQGIQHGDEVELVCEHKQTLPLAGYVGVVFRASITGASLVFLPKSSGDAQDFKSIDVLGQRDYQMKMVPLIKKLAQDNAIKKTQVFYLSKVILEQDGRRVMWIYCPQTEDNKLILYENDSEDLSDCRVQYNLRTDVVDTADEIHGSSFLMTKAEAQELISKCQKGSGIMIVRYKRQKGTWDEREFRGK